jgi:hypothetical protein
MLENNKHNTEIDELKNKINVFKDFLRNQIALIQKTKQLN